MKSRRVTMQDVADRANVSKTAVSFAFNDTSRLSEATLRHIMAVAEELGYSQDPAARMLRTRKTNSLGLLLPQQLDVALTNPYYTEFMQGIGQTCHREGFTLLLAPPLRGSMLKAIPYAAVDGFIVSGLEYDRGEVSALRQRGVPFVLVDSEHHPGVSSVDIDDGAAMDTLVEHLLDLGHRRFAFVVIETGIGADRRDWRGPVRRRIDGVSAALERHGRSLDDPDVQVIEVACTRSAGERAFASLWQPEGTRPTAIVCFSDIIALGVLAGARRLGVQVPDEVSVTGFDDLQLAQLSRPSLTTIRQPIETKGRLAAEYLVESLAAGADRTAPHQQLLHTALLLRESTGRAPSS
ncbi:LacI family DNA-binding transcriptional regulator [Cellulomonas sp. KRMCY2]|uniref:LacI family DNA-binding transcriptional regulator n=1 Tax=Cellulomonas sp. KRMCY2 TaxID=1304865 RepID=UPI00045EA5FE|nr:LacI family DNA-binding transcriptional regulator [Cellulomonas sp. KRMCY2]